jgi:hypothetical protein
LRFVLGLVLVACNATNGPSGPPGPVAVPNTAPTLAVDIGTGEISFEPLSDGGEVTLVHGPQGGFHIWTSVRVRDPNITDVHVNLRARHEDGSAAGPPSSAAVLLAARPDGAADATGMRNFITAKEAAGTHLFLRAEVISTDGRHGASERRVVLEP